MLLVYNNPGTIDRLRWQQRIADSCRRSNALTCSASTNRPTSLHTNVSSVFGPLGTRRSELEMYLRFLINFAFQTHTRIQSKLEKMALTMHCHLRRPTRRNCKLKISVRPQNTNDGIGEIPFPPPN